MRHSLPYNIFISAFAKHYQSTMDDTSLFRPSPLCLSVLLYTTKFIRYSLLTRLFPYMFVLVYFLHFLTRYFFLKRSVFKIKSSDSVRSHKFPVVPSCSLYRLLYICIRLKFLLWFIISLGVGRRRVSTGKEMTGRYTMTSILTIQCFHLGGMGEGLEEDYRSLSNGRKRKLEKIRQYRLIDSLIIFLYFFHTSQGREFYI